jgi:hypothetical protein
METNWIPKGGPHKNRNPTSHETNMKKGKERNNMRQNKSGTPKKTKHTLEKLFCRVYGKQAGHHEFRYIPPGTKT